MYPTVTAIGPTSKVALKKKKSFAKPALFVTPLSLSDLENPNKCLDRTAAAGVTAEGVVEAAAEAEAEAGDIRIEVRRVSVPFGSGSQ